MIKCKCDDQQQKDEIQKRRRRMVGNVKIKRSDLETYKSVYVACEAQRKQGRRND